MLIADGTLVPTRDHAVAEQSKNYRYSTLVAGVGRLLPGDRNDCRAWAESGAKVAVGKTTTIAEGGHLGTELVMPHRRTKGQAELPPWKKAHNSSNKQVRVRVEHVFTRMKSRKILRDCRLKGDGVHHAMIDCITSPSPGERPARRADTLAPHLAGSRRHRRPVGATSVSADLERDPGPEPKAPPGCLPCARPRSARATRWTTRRLKGVAEVRPSATLFSCAMEYGGWWGRCG